MNFKSNTSFLYFRHFDNKNNKLLQKKCFFCAFTNKEKPD